MHNQNVKDCRTVNRHVLPHVLDTSPKLYQKLKETV